MSCANTTDSESPYYGIPVKTRLNGASLGSENCFERVGTWLSSCDSKHSYCQKSSSRKLPTRVIDVGESDSEIRLHVSTRDEADEYTALSHCWGDPAAIPKLMKSNYLEYQVSIPTTILSRTFKDAIIITRQLRFRYIWIDALSIVQDDSSDWEAEASLMAEIYSNAVLTIGAVDSEDGTGGCLYERESRHENYYPHHGLFTRAPIAFS